MSVARALLLAAVLLVAGCGDDSSTETTTTAQETAIVRVYFLRDGKVWPVAREVEVSAGTPTRPSFTAAFEAMWALRGGPSEDEREEMQLASDLPSPFADALAQGNRTAQLNTATDLSDTARAQIVYTLTQFQAIEAVEINGTSYTRADFEEQTPSVLVESPLPFDEVETPLRVTGTANTFEANFQYELLDSDRNVVDENFVTATSGTGTRGTFDFTTAAVDDVTTLVVFESSAEDGSRMNEVEIPLTVAP